MYHATFSGMRKAFSVQNKQQAVFQGLPSSCVLAVTKLYKSYPTLTIYTHRIGGKRELGRQSTIFYPLLWVSHFAWYIFFIIYSRILIKWNRLVNVKCTVVCSMQLLFLISSYIYRDINAFFSTMFIRKKIRLLMCILFFEGDYIKPLTSAKFYQFEILIELRVISKRKG